jgi:hypothetical protein
MTDATEGVHCGARWGGGLAARGAAPLTTSNPGPPFCATLLRGLGLGGDEQTSNPVILRLEMRRQTRGEFENSGWGK